METVNGKSGKELKSAATEANAVLEFLSRYLELSCVPINKK